MKENPDSGDRLGLLTGTRAQSKRRGLVAAIIGVILLAYFIGVAILLKRMDIFTVGLLIISVLWIVASVKIDKLSAALKRVPRLARYALTSVLILFLASVVVVEGLVIFNMNQKPASGADYVIILGCQVRGSTPSSALTDRVNTAIEYLEQNEGTNVVASGGQGPGEDLSEAAAMKELLLQRGIDSKRIFLENQSTTTLENLKFSNELYNLYGENIVVVSSDYHLFRALSLARKMGYSSVSGFPSKGEWFPVPAYLMREYVGIVGYWLTGKI